MKVTDNFRKNELSFVPGGCTVVVEKDGKVYEYDKIKCPRKYIETVKRNPNVSNAYIKN